MGKLKNALALLLLAASAHAQAPDLALFESQMTTYGAKHCATLKDPNVAFDPKLAATYYDAIWVYFNIADYTHDSSWLSCAQAAEAVYRDKYVVPNNGNIPGYWNFTHGMTIDAQRNGDTASKAAVISVANNGAYAPDTTPIEWTADNTMSREVAYNIMTMLNAESLGRPRTARYGQLVDQAFGHMNQWFVLKTAKYIRPFMVSLTAHALISNNEKNPDARTLPAIKGACDWLWANMWSATGNAFRYTNVDTATFPSTDPAYNTGGTELAPDLNLLIAPIFAWVYKQTGDSKYLSEADAIFSGGVKQAYLVNAKQYNQNYRLSFKYLEWRGAAPVPTPTPHPCEKSPGSTTPFSAASCTNYFLKQIRDGH